MAVAKLKNNSKNKDYNTNKNNGDKRVNFAVSRRIMEIMVVIVIVMTIMMLLKMI